MHYYTDQQEPNRRPWAFFLALLVHVALFLLLMLGGTSSADQPLPAKTTSKTISEP